MCAFIIKAEQNLLRGVGSKVNMSGKNHRKLPVGSALTVYKPYIKGYRGKRPPWGYSQLLLLTPQTHCGEAWVWYVVYKMRICCVWVCTCLPFLFSRKRKIIKMCAVSTINHRLSLFQVLIAPIQDNSPLRLYSKQLVFQCSNHNVVVLGCHLVAVTHMCFNQLLAASLIIWCHS